jgi:uncharacterized membrane protein
MKVERALGALVRGTTTSELASITDEVAMAIRVLIESELMFVAIVFASSRKFAQILLFVSMDMRMESAISNRASLAARPPGTTLSTVSWATRRNLLIISLLLRGILEMESKERWLLTKRNIEGFLQLLVGRDSDMVLLIVLVFDDDLLHVQ